MITTSNQTPPVPAATRTTSASAVSSDAVLDSFVNDPEIMADVDRLLAGRTRDIRLSGAIALAYRHRFSRQTAKIVRSWMLWVLFLDLFMMAFNTILLPWDLALAMFAPSAMIVPVALWVIYVWGKPRDLWLAGWALLAGLAAILLCVAWMGVVGAPELLERYLHIMLFVAITGIIIFNLPYAQSILIAIMAMTIYLVFQIGSLDGQLGKMLSGFLFYASGVGATVLARRTMNILSYKSFLLELRVRQNIGELARSNRRLEHLSRLDGLTGVANRHHLDQRLAALSSHAGAIALVMCDIDDFKGLNDTLGHQAGDLCLKHVADILTESTRNVADCVARYGGEEFVVVLTNADETLAWQAADRIRRNVAKASIANQGARRGKALTVSLGVAVSGISRPPHDLETLLMQADEALYAAKRNGRNRVEMWSSHFERNQVRA